MDGLSVITTGTVGTTLSYYNSNIITTSGNLISSGDTPLIGGHLLIGVTTLLALLIGITLDRKYKIDLDTENQEEKEQE